MTPTSHGASGGTMRTGGRPAAPDLTDADHDLMDEENWEDFLDWQRRRCNGHGYLGEFNAQSTLGWVSWLKKYCLKLRATIRASRNAQHIHELETENHRLSVLIATADEMTSVETMKSLRAENSSLRREMARWQMRAPKGR